MGEHLLPNAEMVRRAGFNPEPAGMVGGVCDGKAIDRNVFTFTAAPRTVIVEPAVYNQGFAYRSRASREPVGHYHPGVGDPVRAEIVVPRKLFDGAQHLEIVPSTVRRIPGGQQIPHDSVAQNVADAAETRERRLYAVSFDLSSLRGAVHRVGLAV